MRVAIIVPYFGRFPDYFQTFLDSCRPNKGFEWIIFTNDKTEYSYPENVHCIDMSFEQCKELVQSRFDFEITLHTPQKLCDYKCAYGYIFNAYLTGYDFWGYCDLDQIFGDLSAFVTDERLETYDKIYSLGHLTLYRNTEDNNRTFMSPLKGRERYKEVFTTEIGCAFDEWLPDNINEIYLESERPALYENDGADVDPYSTALTVVEYNVEGRFYKRSDIKNSIFVWEKGKVFQLCLKEGALKRREYPYVHLQKRKMTDKRISKESERYYIVPNCFVDGDADAVKLLKRAAIWRIFNHQYFRVKWKSLKYRIKSKNWKFTSVFK